MGERSRRKGNEFENATARVLSQWVSPRHRDFYALCPVSKLPFRRKPADNANIVTDWVGGWDLIHSPTVAFPYAVECKAVARCTLSQLDRAGKVGVWAWWQQAVEQAAALKLAPMLVFAAEGEAHVLTYLEHHPCPADAARSRTALTPDVPARCVSVLLLDDLATMAPPPAKLPGVEEGTARLARIPLSQQLARLRRLSA
jgi:hypothetical protein